MNAPSQSAAEIVPPQALEAAWHACGGDRFGVSREEFCGAVVAHLSKTAGSSGEAERLCNALHHEQLALALGCAKGDERAWDVFLSRYRSVLHEAAYRIAPNDATAREIADGLIADLYGLRERDGERRSKFSYYSGRGSLEGWLRTVVAQQYVDRYRGESRTASLDEQVEAGVQFAAPSREDEVALDPRLEVATDDALASLNAGERYLLASYFLDGRTLAEIGRTLGAHESTIQRRLMKCTRTVRERIVKNLMRAGMSKRQAHEALETDVRDMRVDIRARLAQETRGPTFKERDF